MKGEGREGRREEKREGGREGGRGKPSEKGRKKVRRVRCDETEGSMTFW
jgi:hypothetical protein